MQQFLLIEDWVNTRDPRIPIEGFEIITPGKSKMNELYVSLVDKNIGITQDPVKGVIPVLSPVPKFSQLIKVMEMPSDSFRRTLEVNRKLESARDFNETDAARKEKKEIEKSVRWLASFFHCRFINDSVSKYTNSPKVQRIVIFSYLNKLGNAPIAQRKFAPGY